MSARIVSHFSCGATSAVATKLAIAEYGDRVEVVNGSGEIGIPGAPCPGCEGFRIGQEFKRLRAAEGDGSQKDAP